MKRTTRTGVIITAGVVGLIALGSALGHGSTPTISTTPSASVGTSATPSASASAQRYVVSQRVGWAFKVTGDAPAGVSITYGNDSDNRDGGTVVPFRAALPGQSGAVYWFVTAQLQGSGDITARVYETRLTHWSDGTTSTTRKVVAHAHASGDYNIANAEYVGVDAGVHHVGG